MTFQKMFQILYLLEVANCVTYNCDIKEQLCYYLMAFQSK